MVLENKKMFSYTGMMGRKAYIINYLIVLVLVWAFVAALAVMGTLLVHFSGLPKEQSDVVLGAIIIPAAFASLPFNLGFLIRRIRDILDLRDSNPWRDAALIIGFMFTGGFCFIGALAVLFWPGVLYKQSQQIPPASNVTTT